MSASREKNKRKEQAAVPETANEAKKGMSKGLKTTLIAVCTVLVVCIVVFFYMLTSGFFASHTTAATVSGHNLPRLWSTTSIKTPTAPCRSSTAIL